MAIKFIKSKYSFVYSDKGMFIMDNNTLRKSKLFYSQDIKKRTLIKGKILKTSFTIKSYPDKLIIKPNGQRCMINYTAFIYLNDKHIGDLEKDQVVILSSDNFDRIPITLRMDDLVDYYFATYFDPEITVVKVFHKNKLMGYAKKNKDKYNLYTTSEEDFPLFFTLFIAAFNSSIT